jgi:hypothetical protein
MPLKARPASSISARREAGSGGQPVDLEPADGARRLGERHGGAAELPAEHDGGGDRGEEGQGGDGGGPNQPEHLAAERLQRHVAAQEPGSRAGEREILEEEHVLDAVLGLDDAAGPRVSSRRSGPRQTCASTGSPTSSSVGMGRATVAGTAPLGDSPVRQHVLAVGQTKSSTPNSRPRSARKRESSRSGTAAMMAAWKAPPGLRTGRTKVSTLWPAGST